MGESVKRFFLNLGKIFQAYFKILGKYEKTVVIICFLLIIVSAILLWRNNYLSKTTVVANYGGKYTEGIIVQSQESVKPIIDKLTKMGLVRFDKDGKIIPALAESWEISSDQKTYTFHLLKFLNSANLADVIKAEKNKWQEQKIEIKSVDKNTLQFVLSQPFSPFLASLTEEMFSYGPYTLASESKKELNFISRDDFYLGKPYLTDIGIKIYPDIANLNQALKNKEVDGLAEVDLGVNVPEKFTSYQVILPRYMMLFFNVNSANFSDKNVRVKLAKGEKLDKEISFDLLTLNSDKYLSKANEIKNKWQALGAKANIVSYDAKELQTNIIPSRKYDALIYGLDFGVDPDPYPFWHSSQLAGGLNLSNFSDVDADKLLEEARQTNNQDERNNKYQAFQKILDDQKPAIVLEQTNWQFAATDKIKGIVPTHWGASPADRFFEIWKWYLNEKRVKK